MDEDLRDGKFQNDVHHFIDRWSGNEDSIRGEVARSNAIRATADVVEW